MCQNYDNITFRIRRRNCSRGFLVPKQIMDDEPILEIADSDSRPTPKLDRAVVLVGLMGSGKSSIGRRLASRLGVPFVDADTEIERAAGCSIADIFESYGEAAFRDGERKVMARLLEDSPRVIATGGGAFMDPKTRALIAQQGLSIWLRAELDILVKRCARRNHRPLLNQGDPREILAGLMRQRYPVYAEADIVVDSDDGPHERVVNAIVKSLTDRPDNAQLRAGGGAAAPKS